MTGRIDRFRPATGLANAHVQSILASAQFRRLLIRRRARPMLDAAQLDLLELEDGTRLQAARSVADNPRGVAVLYHGWEGSIDSTYILATAAALYEAGFTVVRLNFRDHGDTHGLNEELFHSNRLEEVVLATRQIADRDGGLPLILAGYSLGGNFALRVSMRLDREVAHTIAISPVINPAAGLFAIENSLPVYHYYFMRKWRQSLARKRELFPDRYQWGDEQENATLRGLTAWLVEQYTDFSAVEDYLDGYSIAGERLSELACATTIVTAADDPIIPVDDFSRLKLPDCAELIITESGGHCGFISSWRLDSWSAALVRARAEAAVENPDATFNDSMIEQETT